MSIEIKCRSAKVRSRSHFPNILLIVASTFISAVAYADWDHTVIMFPPAGATFTVPLVPNARNCVYVTDCSESITTPTSGSTTTTVQGSTTTTTSGTTTTTTLVPAISDIPTPRGTPGWSFDVPIDRIGWTVDVDATETSDATKTALYDKGHLIDDDVTTIWHSPWVTPTPMPHWIIIDMQTQHWVDGMIITPRPYDANKSFTENANVKSYEVWVSNDKNIWGRVANGELTFVEGSPIRIEFLIPNNDRYVKLVINSASNNTAAVAIGDIQITESLRDAVISAGGLN